MNGEMKLMKVLDYSKTKVEIWHDKKDKEKRTQIW
jgi:hypothetical protein